jgi:hypothetical protein
MAAGGSTVASVTNRASQHPKTVTSQGVFQAVPPPVSQQSWRLAFNTLSKEIPRTNVHSNHHIPQHLTPPQFLYQRS